MSARTQFCHEESFTVHPSNKLLPPTSAVKSQAIALFAHYTDTVSVRCLHERLGFSSVHGNIGHTDKNGVGNQV
ncbi:protein of unknown function (plasmid) [Caballeronia sp. S22]